MAESRRGARSFAPLPDNVVKVRLAGEPAAYLARAIAAMPGVTVVTGPDEYPGGRLYLTVIVDEAAGLREDARDGSK